jgi:hypothetical protein
MGIDGESAMGFTKQFNVGDMNDPDVYPGADKRERSQAGSYTDNNSGLTRTEGFERGASSRQIWSDVEQNSDTVDANHNAITHGVDRGQS